MSSGSVSCPFARSVVRAMDPILPSNCQKVTDPGGALSPEELGLQHADLSHWSDARGVQARCFRSISPWNAWRSNVFLRNAVPRLGGRRAR